MFDVIIVGGGPAGLSAALVLGRSRRKVLVCDDGEPRNAKTSELHGYLTRDGIKPLDFLGIGKDELKRYDIQYNHTQVLSAVKEDEYFRIKIHSGEEFQCLKILLATGIKDEIPSIEGFQHFYGKSVFHCPYCDGWENRDKRIGIYAKGKAAYMLALSLKTWSSDVKLFTDGRPHIISENREVLQKAGIEIISDKIKKLEGDGDTLKKVILKNGIEVERDVVFFSGKQKQHSTLAGQLGCEFSSSGFIRFNKKQQSSVPGVFVAGDVVEDVKFVIVAAAEGAKAAIAINIELQESEREKI